MRDNLVINLYCSVCGDILQLATEKESASRDPRAGTDAPSGGFMIHKTVRVNPCTTCYNKRWKPVDTFIKSLQDLTKVGV